MKLLLLDDEGITGFLKKIDDEATAFRKEIAQLVVALDGRVTWNEGWQLSREDRLNLAEAFDKLVSAKNRK